MQSDAEIALVRFISRLEGVMKTAAEEHKAKPPTLQDMQPSFPPSAYIVKMRKLDGNVKALVSQLNQFEQQQQQQQSPETANEDERLALEERLAGYSARVNAILRVNASLGGTTSVPAVTEPTQDDSLSEKQQARSFDNDKESEKDDGPVSKRDTLFGTDLRERRRRMRMASISEKDDTTGLLSSTSEDAALARKVHKHEQLTQEVLQLTQALKATANAFGGALNKDEAVVDETSEAVAGNIQIMGKTNTRLGEYSKSAWSTTWMTWGAVIVAVIVFMFTFMVMRIMPKMR
ncbi:hypothetical protein GQ42DRAFT_52175 [Ramicandelaber brevisporus]|nr:hypothetical protein GQ42DRAFT_52175 [Ramicandelaber brevisporus]